MRERSTNASPTQTPWRSRSRRSSREREPVGAARRPRGAAARAAGRGARRRRRAAGGSRRPPPRARRSGPPPRAPPTIRTGHVVAGEAQAPAERDGRPCRAGPRRSTTASGGRRGEAGEAVLGVLGELDPPAARRRARSAGRPRRGRSSATTRMRVGSMRSSGGMAASPGGSVTPPRAGWGRTWESPGDAGVPRRWRRAAAPGASGDGGRDGGGAVARRAAGGRARRVRTPATSAIRRAAAEGDPAGLVEPRQRRRRR